MLGVIFGHRELNVDGKEGVELVFGEVAHLELDDAEGFVDDRDEVIEACHLELRVLAGVADALAPKLGVLDLVAVDDYVGLFGILVVAETTLATAAVVAATVVVPVGRVVVLPVLVINDVDAEGRGTVVVLVDLVVVGIPQGDGAVVGGVETKLPNPERAVVAADGLADLEAGLVSLPGRYDLEARALVGRCVGLMVNLGVGGLDVVAAGGGGGDRGGHCKSGDDGFHIVDCIIPRRN